MIRREFGDSPNGACAMGIFQPSHVAVGVGVANRKVRNIFVAMRSNYLCLFYGVISGIISQKLN